MRSPEARPGKARQGPVWGGVIGISVVAGPKDCALFESFWQKRKSQRMYPTVRASYSASNKERKGKEKKEGPTKEVFDI